MAANRFQHQSYPTTPSITPRLQTLRVASGNAGEFAELHSSLRVSRVILVHGTFNGDDPLGIVDLLKALGTSSPLMAGTTDAIAAEIQKHTRPLTTAMTGDIGNFTTVFRDRFQFLVGDDPQIELLEPTWSSQNHHLARADLAVRLLHQLLIHPPAASHRVLLWGHSHAGNAFALLTNLLANEPESVAAFFAAAGATPGAHWVAVREALQSAPSPHPLARQVLIVTLETPVRYGWDMTGCRGLVHLIQHRVFDAARPFLAKPLFPPHSVPDTLNAAWGDWVQAFAIAGTDVPTMPTLEPNQRLAVIVESGLAEPVHGLDTRFIVPQRVRDACARWRTGTRCHADGRNLLVEYEPSGELTALGRPIEMSLLGHGVATSIVWLSAHLCAAQVSPTVSVSCELTSLVRLAVVPAPPRHPRAGGNPVSADGAAELRK